MAAISFPVKSYGDPPVSSLSRLPVGSTQLRNFKNTTPQISWPRTSLNLTNVTLETRKAKSGARLRVSNVAFVGNQPEDDGGCSKLQLDNNNNNNNFPTSADEDVRFPTTGLLAAEDFNTGEKNGLVSIGSHRLSLHAAGPDRKPGEPVVITMQGVATSSKGWAAVLRLLKPFVRVCVYDRSGFGQSDVSPQKPTSTTIARELDRLLRSANVAPPYILVGQSWGGMLSREFFSLHPDNVVGMVLVDANQEHMLDVLDWREPRLWAIAGKVDFQESTGLTKEHKLSEEEWRAYVEDQTTRKHRKQAVKERAVYADSFRVLAEKAQLHRTPEKLMGDRPLSVVIGNAGQHFRRLYEAAAVKGGHGSEEERAFFLDYLRKDAENHPKLQEELLSLSNNSRLVPATQSGHDVHLTQPELIVDEVRWILEQRRR